MYYNLINFIILFQLASVRIPDGSRYCVLGTTVHMYTVGLGSIIEQRAHYMRKETCNARKYLNFAFYVFESKVS